MHACVRACVRAGVCVSVCVLMSCVCFSELYYTDWGEKGEVVRLGLDGSQPHILGSDFENPNSILTDGDTVYVIDSHLKSRDRGLDVDGAIYQMNRTGTSWANLSGTDLKVHKTINFRN